MTLVELMLKLVLENQLVLMHRMTVSQEVMKKQQDITIAFLKEHIDWRFPGGGA